MYKRQVDRRVHEAADFGGLDPALLERSPFELSGGQKRRVAVAGVMAMKPRILVPVSYTHLDVYKRQA